MSRFLDPFRFLLIAVSGWMNQRQLQVTDYLREENCVLRKHLDARRLKLTNDQRRRLAANAKGSGNPWAAVVTIDTPKALFSWYRILIARKYDGSASRKLGRPRTRGDVEALNVRWQRRTGIAAIDGFEVRLSSRSLSTGGEVRIDALLKFLANRPGGRLIRHTDRS